VEHSAAGALHAMHTLGELQGRLLAYLIAGHHAGLPDWNGGSASLYQRMDNARREGHLDEVLAAAPPNHILDANGLKPSTRPKGKAQELHLWLRILFSCLVDADFLDTEAYMEPERATLRAGYPSIGELLDRFTDHMAQLRGDAPATAVNAVRDRVLTQCIERAREDRGNGLFSLTVPTGGGKTMASLAFALNHAKAHGKQRVIYVIPYLSIIEQTAGVFRQVFGMVNSDLDEPTAWHRLGTERAGMGQSTMTLQLAQEPCSRLPRVSPPEASEALAVQQSQTTQTVLHSLHKALCGAAFQGWRPL
jgi:CRISPR-associated endonuclease/helicase Cas3